MPRVSFCIYFLSMRFWSSLFYWISLNCQYQIQHISVDIEEQPSYHWKYLKPVTLQIHDFFFSPEIFLWEFILIPTIHRRQTLSSIWVWQWKQKTHCCDTSKKRKGHLLSSVKKQKKMKEAVLFNNFFFLLSWLFHLS